MDDFQKRIIIVSGLFFVVTGAVIFGVHISMVEYEIPDPPNYITIIVEVAIGFFIATLVYMITKKQQSDSEKREQSRTIEEHQHYKERFTYELSIFVSRMDIILTQYKVENQRQAMFANISHVKTNLSRLEHINSIFSVPSHIRSQCDDLLAIFSADIESVEHSCMIGNNKNESRVNLVNQVKKFLENEFFQKDNNDVINDRMKKIDDQMSRILAKPK